MLKNILSRLQGIIQQYNTPPSYAPYETLFVRFIISVTLVWTYRECPFEQAHPRGLSKFVDLQPFCVGQVFEVQRVLLVLMAILYIFRIFPVLTCGYMTFNYIATNTVYNSFSIFHGNQILGQIFLIREIAHIYFAIRRLLARTDHARFGSHHHVISLDEEESRLVRLGQEVMAAAYFASVITKMWQSGGMWLHNSHYFIISSMVTRERAHLWGELPSSEASYPLAMLNYFLTVNTIFPKIMFSGGFFTELLAPLFLYNRPVLLIGGIMVFQMHYWIQWIMQLTFGVNMFLATAHFIGPFYWLHKYLSPQPMIARWFNWLQRYPKLFGTTPPIKEDDPQRTEKQQMIHRDDQRGFFASFWRVWRRTPFKLIIVLVIFSLYVRESFPFSHWPMYANPIPQAVYMQIQDSQGQPLMPSRAYIKSSLSQVNKHFKALCSEFWGKRGGYDHRLNREMKCGNVTLYSVMKYTPLSRRSELAKRLPLQLVQTIIKMNDDNQISREVRTVGYLDELPPSAWTSK
eukprot:TRINITY_DN17889_c0_g1_i1.p1 TRINITY_DN17889_c0_g1~~TRINITY_DN17889_c0_g1_i1.p1  ORF type:complete len:517 (-),score=37.85 TRINITY_DN17889_c0_g1_i1:153-1703(-)